MVLTSRQAASLLAVCLLAFAIPAHAVSCLLFPMACLKPRKKYGEEMEALVLDLRSQRTDAYEMRIPSGGGVMQGPMMVANPLQNKRAWYIWFRIGDTLYQAERDETVLQMAYKKPKREDWVGKTVTLRFRDQKWMGIKSAWAVFDRGRGKEWEFVLVSIVGPDGIDECRGRLMCPYQAEVDREAREREQLARLAKAGQKSASEVAPMPDDLPEEAAEPETAAVAEPAAPAEEVAPAPEPPAEPAPAETPPAANAPAAEAGAEIPPT